MIKRYVIIFIVALVVVGLLAGVAVWATKNFEPVEQVEGTDDTDVDEKYEREKGKIFAISNENLLKKVTVKNEAGEFSVYKNEDGKVVIEGAESAPLLTATSTALYECVLKILSESTIELGSRHLEYYGLDKPQASLTATILVSDEGEETYEETFYLGDLTPDCKAYYFCREGSSNVYAVSTYFGRRMLFDLSDLLSLDIYTVYASADTDADVLTMDYGNGTSFRIHYIESQDEYTRYGSSFVMEAPYDCAANPDHVRACFSSVYFLSAESVVCWNPTAEEYAAYGFDNAVTMTLRMNIDVSQPIINNKNNPYYDMTVSESQYVQVTDTYTVGGVDRAKGVYYVMYNDAPVIYAVKADVFAFADYDLTYYRQSTLFYLYLVDIKTMTISFTENGEKQSYQFDLYTKENANGDLILDYILYQGVTVGDDNKDKSCHGFKALYQDIIGIAAFGMAEEPVGAEPVLTVTMTTVEDETVTLELLPIDEDELYYFVRVNSSGQYTVISSRCDNIISDVKKLLNHEDFDAHYV